MNKTIILSLLAAFIFSTLLVLVLNTKKEKVLEPIQNSTANNFEECLAAGYPVLESYPRQCKTLNGQTFVENIGNMLEKTELITMTNPLPNQLIASPLLITGEARGTWYFEASFPIKLYDENNSLMAVGIAQAQSDWMTTDFVPFQVEMIFSNTTTSTKGVLVLEKDNPSGLSEYDDQLIIPIKFQ